MLNKKISLDEIVAELSIKSALFFTWCIPHLDVGGKILGNSDYLKGNVVPYRKDFTTKVIDGCLLEIEAKGLIIIYGKAHKYIKFKGFDKNQNINESRESPSEIPDPTPDLLQSDAGETPIEVNININSNLSKDKVKVEVEDSEFNYFWDSYDKKVGKPNTIREWGKLTKEEKEKIFKVLPIYINSKPDKQFRKDPERFLKHKVFNDEIIEKPNGINKNQQFEYQKGDGNEFKIVQ